MITIMNITKNNLLENWRSTRQILDFGDDIISKNGDDQVEKELIPMRQPTR